MGKGYAPLPEGRPNLSRSFLSVNAGQHVERQPLLGPLRDVLLHFAAIELRPAALLRCCPVEGIKRKLLAGVALRLYDLLLSFQQLKRLADEAKAALSVAA